MPRTATLDRPTTTSTDLLTRPDAWDLFNRCLRDGHLVPLATAPTNATPTTEAERWALEMARTLDDLTAAAWAENTLKGYGWHVTQWGTWCETRDLPPLPLDPAHVAVHLMEFAFAVDPVTGAPARDDEGALMSARTAATVGLRLAALNKLAAFTSTPAPGDSKQVRDLMRGIRRTVGVRPHRRKQAIDHDLLKALLDAAAGRTGKHARNRLAVTLRAVTGLSAQHLAALTWFDLDFDDATITVHARDNTEVIISDPVAVRVMSRPESTGEFALTWRIGTCQFRGSTTMRRGPVRSACMSSAASRIRRSRRSRRGGTLAA